MAEHGRTRIAGRLRGASAVAPRPQRGDVVDAPLRECSAFGRRPRPESRHRRRLERMVRSDWLVRRQRRRSHRRSCSSRARRRRHDVLVVADAVNAADVLARRRLEPRQRGSEPVVRAAVARRTAPRPPAVTRTRRHRVPAPATDGGRVRASSVPAYGGRDSVHRSRSGVTRSRRSHLARTDGDLRRVEIDRPDPALVQEPVDDRRARRAGLLGELVEHRVEVVGAGAVGHRARDRGERVVGRSAAAGGPPRACAPSPRRSPARAAAPCRAASFSSRSVNSGSTSRPNSSRLSMMCSWRFLPAWKQKITWSTPHSS